MAMNRKRSRAEINGEIIYKQKSEIAETGSKKMNLVAGLSQRYLVTVEYIGTRFYGFQKQEDCRTVQGVLEEAFAKLVGQPVTSACSSRTDAGVHALRNVCHVDVVRTSKRKPGEALPPHKPEVIHKGINHFLQKEGDVSIVDVRCIPSDFHARFQAKERTYHYRILAGNMQQSIFEKDRAWNVSSHLNLQAMQKACDLLVGHHDFSSFRAAGCQARSPVKTLDEFNILETPLWPCFPSQSERNQLHFGGQRQQLDVEQAADSSKKQLRCYVVTARAQSFVYHQVRLMVGTIKAVGSGVLSVDDVKRILEAKSITSTPVMAPACGLYLAEVKYDFNSSFISTEPTKEIC